MDERSHLQAGMFLFMKKYSALLFAIALIAAFSGCEAGSTRATITGTLTLPAAATFTYYVLVENDTYTAVAETSGIVAVASPIANYSISDVLYGTYYIYAWVDDDADGYADHEGYYGGVTVIPPSAPNAVVPSSGTVVFNITFSH
jgi:hypothetical protein